MLRKQWPVLSGFTMITILAAAVIILAEFGTFGNAQGQGNLTQGNETAGNVTLTPEQKDAICNPNNPLSKLNPVNTTESKICGIPKTINATNSTASNMTTGEETPPPATSIAPSANTTTGAQPSSSDLASQILRNLGGNQTTTGAQQSAPSSPPPPATSIAPSATPPS